MLRFAPPPIAAPQPETAGSSPYELALRSKLLDALMRDSLGTEPIGHWTQGAAKLVGAAAARKNMQDLIARDRALQGEAAGLFSSLIPGGQPAPATPPTPATPAAAPPPVSEPPPPPAQEAPPPGAKVAEALSAPVQVSPRTSYVPGDYGQLKAPPPGPPADAGPSTMEGFMPQVGPEGPPQLPPNPPPQTAGVPGLPGSPSGPAPARPPMALGGPQPPPQIQGASQPQGPLPPQYMQAIQRSEGYNAKPYWDYRQWTSGYGTRASGPGEVIDRQEAERRFSAEIGKAAELVDRFAPNLPEGPRAALVSLTYNAGPGWMKAGLGEAVRAGDMVKANQLFRQYVNAGGKQLPGLVTRRNAEAQWFNQGGEQPSPVRVADSSGGLDRATLERMLRNPYTQKMAQEIILAPYKKEPMTPLQRAHMEKTQVETEKLRREVDTGKPLPAETAAKVGMMRAALDSLPTVRRIFLDESRSGVTGTGGEMFNYYAGRGDIGEGTRLVTGAIESVLRTASGAAVPETEVKRYAQLFMPTPYDTMETRRRKLDALERWISQMALAVTQGRGISPEETSRLSAGTKAGMRPLQQMSDEDLLNNLGLSR